MAKEKLFIHHDDLLICEMWDWKKGGAEMVMNAAYIFIVMLSSKARTWRF